MDQAISKIIETWGIYGLILLFLGFIIYENFFKKNNTVKEAKNGGLYTKDDMIY